MVGASAGTVASGVLTGLAVGPLLGLLAALAFGALVLVALVVFAPTDAPSERLADLLWGKRPEAARTKHVSKTPAAPTRTKKSS